MAKIKLSAQKTMLLVGEGPAEAAFLKYLKTLYHQRKSGWAIKIIPAQGGSPENILEYTLRCKTGKEDEIFIVLDTDKPLTKSLRKKALENEIKFIEIKPKCLDCFLLNLLNKTVPIKSETCKKHLGKLLKNKKTSDKESYQSLFTHKLLEERRKQNKILDALIKLFIL